MFKVGDLAVYPAYGVGRIISIEEKNFSGQKKVFYVLKILRNGIKVMVPQKNANGNGLRCLIDEKKTSRIFRILKNKEISVNHQNWTKRFREYQNKIKTGSAYEVAEVIKDLHLTSLRKDLSFGEKRILEMAQKLLVQELSIALSKSEEEIEKKIKKCLRAN